MEQILQFPMRVQSNLLQLIFIIGKFCYFSITRKVKKRKWRKKVDSNDQGALDYK